MRRVFNLEVHITGRFSCFTGGTAGCVLASRLSEDSDAKVLLVERGVLADSWASRVPLISSNFAADNAPVYKWKTVPQEHANGQEFQVVAGKALGGTSRINSMLYTRGAPAEWNSWRDMGRSGCASSVVGF